VNIIGVIDELLKGELLDWTRSDMVRFQSLAANGNLRAEDEGYIRSIHARIERVPSRSSTENLQRVSTSPPASQVVTAPAEPGRVVEKSDLVPLTDLLIARHGWNFFDFKIKSDMAARVSGGFTGSRFPLKGSFRSHLRSGKLLRRWLRLDHVTPFDQLLQPNTPIWFEKAGFCWLDRRGLFELWDPLTGLASIDALRRSRETKDETLFDRVATVTELSDYDFTVEVDDKQWKVGYVALTFTPYVYLPNDAGG
jgi:hypothetical protein